MYNLYPHQSIIKREPRTSMNSSAAMKHSHREVDQQGRGTVPNRERVTHRSSLTTLLRGKWYGCTGRVHLQHGLFQI